MTNPARRPRRIQRKRTKGWTMPRGAVFVGRGTPFGNGYKIGERDPDTGNPLTRDDVCDRYAEALVNAQPETLAVIRDRLTGRDLACWCRLDQRCHADLLLVAANDPDLLMRIVERQFPDLDDEDEPTVFGAVSEPINRSTMDPDAEAKTLIANLREQVEAAGIDPATVEVTMQVMDEDLDANTVRLRAEATLRPPVADVFTPPMEGTP